MLENGANLLRLLFMLENGANLLRLLFMLENGCLKMEQIFVCPYVSLLQKNFSCMPIADTAVKEFPGGTCGGKSRSDNPLHSEKQKQENSLSQETIQEWQILCNEVWCI